MSMMTACFRIHVVARTLAFKDSFTMYRLPSAPIDPQLFTQSDATAANRVVSLAKDKLLMLHNRMVTPVHFKKPVECYGLLNHRESQRHARRELMIVQGLDAHEGQFLVDFKIDPAPAAPRTDAAGYATGQAYYAKDAASLDRLIVEVVRFMHDGELPNSVTQ